MKKPTPKRQYLTIDLAAHPEIKLALEREAKRRNYKMSQLVRQILTRLLLDREIDKITI